jgi:type IV pilus assembly protein PilA
MLIRIHERLSKKDEGFTLIELMVVVLIIAILIAIAIPTFLGARKRAQDKQAQSNLRNALTAEKTYYVDNQSYADDGVAAELTALQDIENNLQWANTDASVRGVDVFSVTTMGGVTGAGLGLQSNSKSGRVFCMADVGAGSDAGTYYANAASGGSCPAIAAAMAGWSKDAGVGWKY